jgi:hypothetical protein
MSLGIILTSFMGIILISSCVYYLFGEVDFKDDEVPTWKSVLGCLLGIGFLSPLILYFLGVE